MGQGYWVKVLCRKMLSRFGEYVSRTPAQKCKWPYKPYNRFCPAHNTSPPPEGSSKSEEHIYITLWSQDLFIHKPFQLSGEHTALLPSRRWKLFKHTEAFTVLPGTHLLLVERVYVWVKALPRGTASQQVQPSRRSNLRSLACMSRSYATTEPQRPFLGNHFGRQVLSGTEAICPVVFGAPRCCISPRVAFAGFGQYLDGYLLPSFLGGSYCGGREGVSRSSLSCFFPLAWSQVILVSMPHRSHWFDTDVDDGGFQNFGDNCRWLLLVLAWVRSRLQSTARYPDMQSDDASCLSPVRCASVPGTWLHSWLASLMRWRSPYTLLGLDDAVTWHRVAQAFHRWLGKWTVHQITVWTFSPVGAAVGNVNSEGIRRLWHRWRVCCPGIDRYSLLVAGRLILLLKVTYGRADSVR